MSKDEEVQKLSSFVYSLMLELTGIMPYTKKDTIYLLMQEFRRCFPEVDYIIPDRDGR